MTDVGYSGSFHSLKVQYIYTSILIYSEMKMLFIFLLLSLAINKTDIDHTYLLIFTGEGTFYKLNLETKYVEWYSALDTNLLDFTIVDKDTDKIPSYILPTLDGHFLYIDAQSQILIDRKEVQQLLNVCFESESRRKEGETFLQYFIYQKYEYYIINLNNGDVQDIEKILKNGIIPKLDRMAVLKVSKKYLKQLKSDYSVVWSTLSSEIDLMPAASFLKNPEMTSNNNKDEHNKVKFELKRLGNNVIELINGEQSFEIGGRGHIINIFSNISPEKGFLKHQMKYYHKEVLALQDKSNKKLYPVNLLDSFINNQKPIFMHSDQIKSQKKDKTKTHDLQVCVNTFRNIKALTDQSPKGFISKNTMPFHIYDQNGQINNSLSLKYLNNDLCNTTTQNIIYGPTKDQPYVWVAMMIGLITFVLVVVALRIKMKNIMKQWSNRQIQTDKKLLEFENKLGKFQQLQKMYEVHWDKIIYKVVGDKWYQHIVFEGKFLNQEAIVYAVRQQGTDVISIEYKLNLLLNFSHKGVAKLYYYTKNSQFLLIFTEKISPLSLKTFPAYFNLDINYQIKKNIITEILEATAYLDGKIQIFQLPNEAVHLELRPIEAEPFLEYTLKINSVPCLLRKYGSQDSQLEDSKSQSQSISLDNNTYQLRLNLISISHLILHKGQTFDKIKIDAKLKDEAYSQDQYLQFYDFVLYQVKSKQQPGEKDIQGGPLENLRDLMFKQILDHPFLWDSKRKILFLSDFSNYIETHIDQTKVKKLQFHARNYNIVKIPWIREFHFLFVREVNNYRKYDHESVRDLIRVIRNKLNHFHEIPRETKMHIGITPQGFIEYCLGLFPKLLHFAFVYARKKKWKLHMK